MISIIRKLAVIVAACALAGKRGLTDHMHLSIGRLAWPRRAKLDRSCWTLVSLPAFLLLIAGCSAPVEVKWSTETEMNTAGFNLYRSETADGPFDLKINDQLIPASPDPLTGGDYTYLDRTTQSGITYFYELEEVELTGAATRHGPIMVKAQGFSLRNLLFATLAACCGIAIWVFGKKTIVRSRQT